MATQADIDANNARYAAAQAAANAALAAGNTAAAHEQHKIMQAAAESNQALAPQVAATNDAWHREHKTGPYAVSGGGGGGGGGGGSSAPPAAFSAVQILENLLFQATGIRGLGTWASDLSNRGASPTEIIQALRYGTDTSAAGKAAYQAYLQAFPKMDTFIREGIFAGENPELQYISYRNTVKEAAQRYGIMDNLVTNDRIATYIEGRNSANEIVSRMGQAAAAVASTPTETYAILQDYYGVNNGDLISFYLDPTATEDMLKQRYTAARIGTEAARQQFGVNVTEAEALAQRGVTVDEANRGFGTAAQRQAFMQGRGETATRGEVMGSVFGEQEAAAKVERIAKSRIAEFEQGGSFLRTERGAVGLGTAATR